jgi:FHS family glucose/mannose:H+ symporter-like MFS transporter
MRAGRWYIVALYLAFTLTGLGQTLAGSILPVLTAHWSMHDARAGLLFAAQFAGSACGGLLTRARFRMTLAGGVGAVAISSAALAYASSAAAIPLFFFYGLGLGAAMTATSMLVGSRYTERRGAALSLLNFFWSGGAAVCPLLMARLLGVASVRAVFLGVAGVFALTLALLAATADAEPVTAATEVPTRPRAPMRMVLFFALLAFLYVGIESTMGGWLSTYAHRMGVNDARHATAMAAFFWGALLAGRALSSAVLLVVSERGLYFTSLASVAVGIGFVLAAHSPWMLAAGAVITGLGLAPIFPLNLALFMARAGEYSRAGITLALAGFGGSVLPWATGLISGDAGSLRLGLLVPAAAVAMMMIMAAAATIGPEAYLRRPRSTA